MDAERIGRRVAYWRSRRRMTQQTFGTLMGKSRRWVQDFEAGQRQADPRLSVLERAAEVLSISLDALLSDRAETPEVDAAELAELHAVMHRPDVLTGAPETDKPIDLDDVRRRVAYGWLAFQASDYSPLGRVLPPLLVDATAAAATADDDDRPGAFGLLALSYQLTATIATKFGDDTLASHAADRAVVAAQRSEDPVAVAGAARHLVDAMFHRGRCREAVDLALAIAGRHEEALRRRGPQGLSVLGMLYLKAAMAAATAEFRREVPDLLGEAAATADELGVDGNAMWTAFGPTNVQIHRVSAHVRMSDGGEGVEAAADIDPTGLPRERRALHGVDVARALALAGRRDEAVTRLIDAAGHAAEEVYSRPGTRRLVEELRLLGVSSATEGRLRTVAARCGLPA